AAHKAINEVDLSDGQPILEEDFALKSLLGWMNARFDVAVEVDDIKGLEPRAIRQTLLQKAHEAYERKEAEFPVVAALSGLASKNGIDGNALMEWASRRFQTELSIAEMQGKNLDEIRNVLIEHSKKSQHKADEMLVAVKEKVATLFPEGESESLTLAQAT